MSELDKLIVGAAAVMAVIYLVRPAAVWRITKEAAEWFLIILALIWAL